MKKLGRIEYQNRHNRIGYFVGCLMVCASLFLTACSKDKESDDENLLNTSSGGNLLNAGNTANVAQEKEWVYVPERIEIADKRADYESMQLIGDTVCYISRNGESEDEKQNICQYSLSERELTSIPVDWKDDGSIREICCYVFDEDCNVWLIANVYSANFSQFRRFLYKFDAEGKNLFFKDVTEQLRNGASMSIAADRQGRIYVFTGEYSEKTGIWLYTADGSYHGIVSYDFSENVQFRGVVAGDDGRFHICTGKGEDADHCTLAEVDFERKQLTECIEDFPAVNGVCADPTGQYDFLVYDNAAAYGYDLAARKKEELFVWGDSDVNGYYVKYLSLLGDGRYFCTVADWMNDDKSVVLLTKTSAKEVPRRLELVLATVDGGSETAALAVDFNRNNDQYHITVKNYGSLTDLYNAILARETIDIIDLAGVNVEDLSRQGVFEDLAPWLEHSETFTRDNFLDGILEAYTFDGTLTGIPESFWLRTVVGDRSMMENGTGLSAPGGRTF